MKLSFLQNITVVFKINQARDCGKEMIEEDEYAWYLKTGWAINLGIQYSRWIILSLLIDASTDHN